MNLVLCGMMGAGKTSVGVKIAELTDLQWYDTDLMIEHRYGKISDIFEYYGEGYFRRLETELVQELSEQDGLVISTGGGLVLKPENNELLQKNGKIVFLRAELDTLEKRLRIDDSRPLLHGDASLVYQKLEKLLKERTPVYEAAADYTVRVDGKTVEEIARETIAIVGWTDSSGDAQDERNK